MKKRTSVEFSVKHPKLVMAVCAIVTLIFMSQFPWMKTDTNPKHMLFETSDVRIWNDEVDRTFGLYGCIISKRACLLFHDFSVILLNCHD